MIDEINKRIIELMVRLNLQKASFARELDVSLPLITHITSGRNKPGLELLQRILSHFKDVNPDWLLLGVGLMYREKPQQLDVSPFISAIQAVEQEIESIKAAQKSVIQYHRLLLDEVKHLAEMDQLLDQNEQKLLAMEVKLDALKRELLSKQ